MTVSEFAAKINGRIVTGEPNRQVQISGIYCCDLLSWVMSHAPKGAAWITVHAHLNIVAVASLAELSCVVVPEGIQLEDMTVTRAVQENIPIISTGLSTYSICCTAHDCGL